jgi:hypothetical protein
VRVRELLARCALAASTAIGAGCSPSGPGDVDLETVAADVDACIRDDPSCIKRGQTLVVDALEPDGAIRLQPGASIELPLIKPGGVGTLAYLTLGVVNYPDDQGRHLVNVDVGTGALPVEPLSYNWRQEVIVGGKPGPTFRITATYGVVDLIYVVGRWNP